jgi:hypothetical protein
MIPLRLAIDTNILISATIKPAGQQRTGVIFREILLDVRRCPPAEVMEFLRNRLGLLTPRTFRVPGQAAPYFSRIWSKNVRAGDKGIAVGCPDECNFLPPLGVLLYGTREQ